MAQGQRWAAHGGGQAPPARASAGHPGTGSPCPPLPAGRCAHAGGEDAHVAEHTSNDCSARADAFPTDTLPTPALSITAAAGTRAAHRAGAGLLPCPSSKHSA